MRIGLMLRHLGRQAGGTGTYTNQIVEQMLAVGDQHTYVALYDDPAQRGSFGKCGNLEEVVLPSPAKFLWDQLVVPRAAQRLGLDIIFNPKLTIPLVTSRPTVFVQHGADGLVMPSQYPLYDRVYHSVFRGLYWASASGVVCISEDTRRRFIAKYGERRSAKTCVVYHGVNEIFFREPVPDKMAQVRAKYGLEGPYILYLGQIYGMKNVGRIIQAYDRVRQRIGRKLVIAGKPSYFAERDLGWIDRLGLRDHVVQTGWIPDEDVPHLMRMADLFVFPSLYEGFGIPLIEAMAVDCPVVTSNAGACPEVVGDAALIVEPTDIDAIAGAICRVLEDAVLRRRLVEKGAARAREFTWPKAAASTIDFLETVYANRHV